MRFFALHRTTRITAMSIPLVAAALVAFCGRTRSGRLRGEWRRRQLLVWIESALYGQRRGGDRDQFRPRRRIVDEPGATRRLLIVGAGRNRLLPMDVRRRRPPAGAIPD